MKPSVVLALLLATLSSAGQSRPKEMTLDQVAEEASLVVVAVRDTPATLAASVDLGAGRTPFRYGIRRFRVLQTLRGSLDSPNSASLRTVGHDVGTLLHLEKDRLSKTFFSPFLAAGRGLLETRDTLILFLHEANERGEHPFVAQDACAPLSGKARIQRILSRSP